MTENFRDLSLNDLGKIFSGALSPYGLFRPEAKAISVAENSDLSIVEKSRYTSYKIEIIVNIPKYDLEKDGNIPF